MLKKKPLPLLFIILQLTLSFFNFAQAQGQNEIVRQTQKVRTVNIPISIFTKKELRENQAEELLQAGTIVVKENGDEQVVLSIRSVTNAPLALAVLIQDDLSSNLNLQLKDIANFIRNLPVGSRVMVAYLRGGTLQVRQKFTEDLEKAAKSLRLVISNSAVAGSPYEGVDAALKRFDALPTGRRAILLISDGLDASRGVESSSPSQSIDLEQSVLKAQRKSVAVYSIYNAASLTDNGNSRLILNGQGALNRISEETGARAFFQGTSSPISFSSFFADLNLLLKRQFALTYLSTHMKKGFHKIKVNSTNSDIKIEHPQGYFYR
jgi:VWFA-related protein